IVAGRRHGRLAAGVLAGGVLILGLVLARVQYYKTILSEGRAVALALAPVDPRSLMQGDYMDLDYAIRRQVEGWLDEHPPVKDALDASGRGWLLLRLDDQGVGQLQEVTAEAPSDADDQTVALVFRWRPRERSGWQSSGADWGGRNWFFPEGQGARYEKARYGVLRVARDGKSLLAELLDEGMKPL
ncbi:MAG: GDYXXLXY domain-containing protein, partial [Castellaniella sp.]